MPLGTDAAYAFSSWSRFDEVISDELLRAVCGAFVWVAASDGDVSQVELDRFIGMLTQRADRFPALDRSKLEATFRDLGEAILSDPEAGRQRALEHVAVVKGLPGSRELVRSAAQIAMVANGKTTEPEKIAVAAVAEALGLEN